MPSLRLRVLLAIASALLCAMPLLLHLLGFLSPSPSPSSCLQLPTSSSLFLLNASAAATPPPDLRLLSSSWNHLSFPSSPASPLRIALFVKAWPFSSSFAGGLERHALTLHQNLADRGHHIHVFTTDGNTAEVRHSQLQQLHFHICPPNENGKFDVLPAWDAFLQVNATTPFDIVHSESVALPPAKAQEVGAAVAVSWHGIAYEIIHSDIVRELNRLQEGEPRAVDLQRALSDRMRRVVDEVRLFSGYAHHVATSDYAGDVLQTIYQIPLDRVHIIVNGVDEQLFRPDAAAAQRFRSAWGVPRDALVLGVAGRLVKDKGYPLLFHALSQLLQEHPSIFLLMAGDGPWAARFKALSPTNVLVLGPLPPAQLSLFYNAIDIFVNPTVRAQGLDHTLLEAMLSGKPLLATHFPSITRSIIVHPSLGYTFSPNVPSLLASMRAMMEDGRQILQEKGKFCYERASLLFTATKMASAYERLFFCIKDSRHCIY